MKCRWIILLSALICVCGCFPQAKNPMLVSDVSSFYLDDTARQARQAGVDYRLVLEAALDKNPRALGTLFRLTASGVLHGRGADSHAAMLWTLMNQWGDRNFSQGLEAETPAVRQAVVTSLDYAAPGSYAGSYPLTYRLGLHEIRFGGG